LRLNSKKQDELVLNNTRLVYYIVNKFGICTKDYDDFVSIGMIGLVKASRTFDETKKIKFATYAGRCIQNEILMYMRKYKNWINEISLEDPIRTDIDGNDLTIGDVTPSDDEDFLDKIAEQDDFVRLINIILNCFKPKEKFVMLCKIAGMTQDYIAEELNISQSYVARLLKRIKKELKNLFNTTQQFKAEFSMSIQGNLYKISFSSIKVNEFNRIFENLLENLTSTEELPDFRVSSNGEIIILQVPADPEAFLFIAQIIKEIEEFEMLCTTEKNVNKNMTDNIKFKEQPDDKDADKPIKKKKSDEIIANVIPTKKIKKKEKKGVSMTQIREYILTLDSFTVMELKIHFPNMKYSIMTNALQDAKRRGIITSKARGMYIVNKK